MLPRQLMDMAVSGKSRCDPFPLGRGCVNLEVQAHWDMTVGGKAAEWALSVFAFPFLLNATLLLTFFFFLLQKSQL